MEGKAKKQEKLAFIASNQTIDWSAIEPAKDGTYSKKNIQQRINDIRLGFQFPENSIEWILMQVVSKTERVKSLKKDVSAQEKELHEHTKTTIETLTDEQVLMLLHEKWVRPLHENLLSMPRVIVDNLAAKVSALALKYETGLLEVEQNIADASNALSIMLDDLTGSKFDLQAYKELEKLLKPQQNGTEES